MGKLVEGLLAYLSKTPNEQLEKDWAEIDDFNQIGPEIDSFIAQSRNLNRIVIDNLISEITFINNMKNPEYTLDFFIYTPININKLIA